MSKQTIALWIRILALGLFFVFPGRVSAEVIKSFDAKIVVQAENTVSITETILYDSEGLDKHGIFRDISPRSSSGKMMDIKNITVTDQSGIAVPWKRESNNGDVRLKIGDTNSTFVGLKTYIISYIATNAIAHLENNKDEIYWNVTGNKWPFSIENVTAQVILPTAINETQESCYMGVIGSTDGCFPGSGQFYSRRTLVSGEGMTVAVGFPSGVVFDHVPTLTEKIIGFLKKFWPVFIPILTFFSMFQKWYRKGRDAKGSGIIIPEYDAPNNLSPLASAIILNQKIIPRDIVAQIIYLATKGYLSITKVEEKVIFFKKTDYTLRLEKLPTGDLPNFDLELLNQIFSKRDSEAKSAMIAQNINFLKNISLKGLSEGIYSPLQVGTEIKLSEALGLIGGILTITSLLKKYVVDNGYYTSDFVDKINVAKSVASLIPYLALCIAVEFFGKKLFSEGQTVTVFMLIGSILLSVIIFSIFSKFMPAKTVAGIKVKESLLGLKQYIELAEKERIEFHNAPEKNPALFERLLPYAIMFGQEKKWAKAFESIMHSSPLWYRGGGNDFNSVIFTSSLTHGFASSFYSSSGTSGGSGGGGFSGGGGGGGGGGSW